MELSRKKFELNINKYYAYNSQKFPKFDRYFYNTVIKALLMDEMNISNKVIRNLQHVQLSCEYEIYRENNKISLIKRRVTNCEPIIRYVPLEQMFDILTEYHEICGHFGQQTLMKSLKWDYEISPVIVDLFLLDCKMCSQRCGAKYTINKILAINMDDIPNSSVQLNVSVQLDILQMEVANPNGLFHHLLVYTRTSSSFILLRPLMRLCPIEISVELMKIFLDFGPPANVEIFEEYFTLFKGAILEMKALGKVCGIKSTTKKRNVFHEQINMHILKCIKKWMADTGSTNWGLGCHVVQWKLNNNYFNGSTSGGLETPYVTVFSKNSQIKVPTEKTDKPQSIVEICDDNNSLDNDAILIKDEDKNVWPSGVSNDGELVAKIEFNDCLLGNKESSNENKPTPELENMLVDDDSTQSAILPKLEIEDTPLPEKPIRIFEKSETVQINTINHPICYVCKSRIIKKYECCRCKNIVHIFCCTMDEVTSSKTNTSYICTICNRTEMP